MTEQDKIKLKDKFSEDYDNIQNSRFLNPASDLNDKIVVNRFLNLNPASDLNDKIVVNLSRTTLMALEEGYGITTVFANWYYQDTYSNIQFMFDEEIPFGSYNFANYRFVNGEWITLGKYRADRIDEIFRD